MYARTDRSIAATRVYPTRRFPKRLCAVAMSLALSSPAWALPQLVAAMDADGGSVHVIDPAGGGVLFEPFGASFRGGVRVAVGDVTGDGTPDIITGSGPGMTATVRIFDGVNLRPVGAIEPYGADFIGGVYVAAGDVNSDGLADIIVGAGPGSGAVVRVYDGRTQAELRKFTAFAGFNGGVRVAAGDVNGDGFVDIITGPGPGGGPHVKVFDGRGVTVLHDFNAFEARFAGGIFVATGDFNGDRIADLVIGSGADPLAGAGGGPHVKVYSGSDLALLAEFQPYDPVFLGGVRVATADLNGDGLDDIITAPGHGGGPFLTRWLAPDAIHSENLRVFPLRYRGGVFVASSADASSRKAVASE